MANFNELLRLMAKHQDTPKRLAEALNIKPNTLFWKVLEIKGEELTIREIVTIKGRYKLSAEQTEKLFFTSDNNYWEVVNNER